MNVLLAVAQPQDSNSVVENVEIIGLIAVAGF
jgi:hypothetical protein